MRTLTPKEARILTMEAMLPADAEIHTDPEDVPVVLDLVRRGYIALLDLNWPIASLAITAQGLLALRCQAALERGL